jgi:CheY-like chemotaxis protein
LALSDAGFVTTAEVTVAAAIASLGTGSAPDVIVTELMPEPLEAWPFIESRCADTPAIPVIILTSLVRPDRANRRRARAVGCAAFVAKPCSLQQLVRVVTQVHDGSRWVELLTYDALQSGDSC